MIRRALLIIAMAASLLTSCAKEEGVDVPTPQMVDIAIVADTQDDDTRLGVEGNTTHWEMGDRITIGLMLSYSSMQYSTLEIKDASDISTDGKSATFRGSVAGGTYYGIAAIYPAVSTPATNVTLNREDEDNIFMWSFTSYSGSPITVGANSEIPISFSHLMHKMDFKLSLASGYSSDDLNAENIGIEISATTDGAKLPFATTSKLDIRNGSLSTTATANTILVEGKGREFSTMLFPIGSTTNVALTFGVYINGEKRYEIRKPDSGTLSSFRMTSGKSTTVNLELSNDTAIGGGNDEPKAITISANKTTIKANGSDSSTFKVIDEDGTDVTNESTIYYSTGERLNGTSFITATEGTYSFYAECNGVRSTNTITITAEKVTTTGKTIVFAEGVTLTSGWYDVNKYKEGGNGDIQMCWAASASNIIQWWQDRYVAQGGTLPSTAVNGPSTKTYDTGCKYQLALMDVFHDEWDNTYGGAVYHAVPWYFEGKNVCSTSVYHAQPLTGYNGGYFKSAWNSSNVYNGYSDYGYTSNINGYGNWGNGTSLEGVNRLKVFSNYVVEAFEYGMASLTISLASNIYSLHHATTLWGYEIDNSTGLLTRVWLTDSDDLTTESKTAILHEYTVSIGEGKSHVQLSCDAVRYKNVWVVGLIPVAGPGSANK